MTEETYERGELAGQASSILMSILYTARLARFDLLRPVCALESCVTRRTLQCDCMLYRLICYILATKDTVFMTGFVGMSCSTASCACALMRIWQAASFQRNLHMESSWLWLGRILPFHWSQSQRSRQRYLTHPQNLNSLRPTLG